MFSAKTNQPQTQQPKAKKPSANRDTAVTILTSGCHFNGKLFCRGASRIGGKIEGQIISEGLLIIEEEAIITAEIKADEAIIQGRVEGKLHATGRVELCASSQFHGDISTPILIVREGAQFNGHSTMTPRATADESNTKTPRIVAVGAAANSNKKNEGRQPEIGAHRDEAGTMKGPEVNVKG